MKSILRTSAAAFVGAIATLTSEMAPASEPATGQKLVLRMGEQIVVATLNDSEAAKDLLAQLPLTIKMRDHLRREKTGPVRKPLSEQTPGSATYQSGDLGYWRPGGNFVIFYRQDGLEIPSPGIVLLGHVDSQVGIFDIPGPVEVRVERAP